MAAEDYSLALVKDILRGICDTADHEEEWGDAPSNELATAMLSAGLMHDAKFSSLAAAYRAEDARMDAGDMMVKLKYHNGRLNPTKLMFKDMYKDEYTNEALPMEHVREAMKEELEYLCDKMCGLAFHFLRRNMIEVARSSVRDGSIAIRTTLTTPM